MERASVLRNINSTEATTAHLPVEILSIIFLYARPSIDFSTCYHPDVSQHTLHTGKDFHHTLTAVSHLWREVALSTPQLWTTVAVRVDMRRKDPTLITSLVNLQFQRARGSPISIKLDFRDLEASRTSFTARKTSVVSPEHLTVPMLIEHGAAIRDLVLINPPTTLLPSLNGNLSQCQSVTIVAPVRPVGGTLDLTELPSLQRVHLIDFDLPFSLPRRITILHLWRTKIDNVMEFLKKHRKVVDLEIIECALLIKDCFRRPIVFPRLKYLAWSAGQDLRYYSTILRQSQFPALRSLHWSVTSPYDFAFGRSAHQPVDLSVGFFASLPPTLSSLTFTNLSSFKNNWEVAYELLDCVPQVSDLHLVEYLDPEVGATIDDIHLSDWYSPLHVAGVYHFTLLGIGQSSGSKVLQKLYKLSITAQPYLRFREHRNIDRQKIVDMLEALQGVGESRGRFDLSVYPDTPWDDECVLDRLKALVKDGLEVEVALSSRTN
ncbi:hypothetical protein AGABI2DRAFT_116524 [Agaricus bisporus var. bisporus H97]|uniref:hypothetical protein n=1 Tax=Agaricus bisporus var. bisporus (strain H97 / ATCC MYA-4626 / FGSC 10389) TaxID=936046 RepID=UPI00029F5EC9|nr:hypothetical protein AGABI2DRAFT_116524 [Agaricus bisporus var. bisporus H97]EKV49488.1 hypothetical protein AGABI2DRAFT_116524 [Agaricus bisporus var. bisporus H97]